jgi:hypothetical protein
MSKARTPPVGIAANRLSWRRFLVIAGILGTPGFFGPMVSAVAHIGLERAAVPFEVPPFKVQFKARPRTN